MTKTYVLWTETGKEEYIKHMLEKSVLRDIPVRMYVQKKKKLMRGKKGWMETVDILFPGYVLFETDRIQDVHSHLYDLQGESFMTLIGKIPTPKEPAASSGKKTDEV